MQAKQIGQTFISKRTRTGWNAQSYFEFNGDQRLSLHTSKGERGVSTFASVAVHKDGFTTFAIFRDYGKTVAVDLGVKATDKNVEKLHAEALAMVDQIIADARAHYVALEHKRAQEAARLCCPSADGSLPTSGR